MRETIGGMMIVEPKLLGLFQAIRLIIEKTDSEIDSFELISSWLAKDDIDMDILLFDDMSHVEVGDVVAEWENRAITEGKVLFRSKMDQLSCIYFIAKSVEHVVGTLTRLLEKDVLVYSVLTE